MKTNQGLQDESVSKTFKELGDYATLGFIKGVTEEPVPFSPEAAGYLAELGQKAGLKCSEIEAGLAQGAAELWGKMSQF
jgi:hypothetical protein